MKIKVLGACCVICNATFENVQKAAQMQDKNIDVEQVGDILEILKYRAMQTPAVVIDEQVVSVGKSLNLAQAKQLIEQNRAINISFNKPHTKISG